MEALQWLFNANLMPPALIEHVLVPLLWDPYEGLKEAALMGCIKFVKLFIRLMASNYLPPWILIDAVNGGNLECFNYLLSKGAHVSSLIVPHAVQHKIRPPWWKRKATTDLKDAVDFAVHLDHLEMFKIFDSNITIPKDYPYYLEIATFSRSTAMIKHLFRMDHKKIDYYSRMQAFAAAMWDKNYDLVDFIAKVRRARMPDLLCFNAYECVANDSELFLRVKGIQSFDHSRLFEHIEPNNLKMVELIFKDLKEATERYYTNKYVVHVALAAIEYGDRSTVLKLLVDLDFPVEIIDEVRNEPYPHFLTI